MKEALAVEDVVEAVQQQLEQMAALWTPFPAGH